MRNLKNILMGSVAFACVGVASGIRASAIDGVRRRRDVPADCLSATDGLHVQSGAGQPRQALGPFPKATNCASFNGSGFGGMILYAPTGSGNGKTVLRTNSPTSIGTPSNSVPYTECHLRHQQHHRLRWRPVRRQRRRHQRC